MSPLSLRLAALAIAQRVVDEDRFPERLRVVTDTRTLASGDTFLALRGEHFDGHAFVREAVAKGAAAIVVQDETALVSGVPAMIVPDTRRAYMSLAAAAREHFHGQVVAITGSAGKTTTKHLLRQLLGAHFGTQHVLATSENENNELGVSKLLLAAHSDHRVLVVEMGARREGEIADLVRIARPHVGVLTNIGEAHLEFFGSHEVLARTKWGLFSQGAQALLNARDESSVLRAAALQVPPLWFGSGDPLVPGVWVKQDALRLSYGEHPDSYPISVPFPGRHNHANLAAALAAAIVLGVPTDELIAAIPSLDLPAGRYQSVALAGGARVIYDAYNASASGMIAALEAFACENAERRFAVLSSMAELGDAAPALHERVGAHAAGANLAMLLVGGDYAASLMAGAVAAGFPSDRVVPFTNNEQAAQWLRKHAGPKDAVLLKGSRRYRMEEILELLGVEHAS